MTTATLIVDESRCVGCFACEVACNQLNHLQPGQRWIRVRERGPELADGQLRFSWSVRVEPGCNLCRDRQDRPGQPACVQHCIAGCIRLG